MIQIAPLVGRRGGRKSFPFPYPTAEGLELRFINHSPFTYVLIRQGACTVWQALCWEPGTQCQIFWMHRTHRDRQGYGGS